MTFEQGMQVATLIIAIFGPIAAYVQARERLARLEVKVETMWGFQVRRGMVEASQKGWGEIQNPFIVNDDALVYFARLKPELEEWYKKLPPAKRELPELMVEIEKVFGNRIIKEICIPFEVTNAACNLLAAAVASGATRLELPPEMEQ